MTSLIVACVVTLTGILGWAGWIAKHRDRAEGRHSTRAQLAEDERFWATEATIARQETWSQPPADLFPEVHHTASPAPGGGAGDEGQPGDAPGAGLPADRQPWPKHGKPIAGKICERAPVSLVIKLIHAKVAVADLLDEVRAAPGAVLPPAPPVPPGTAELWPSLPQLASEFPDSDPRTTSGIMRAIEAEKGTS